MTIRKYINDNTKGHKKQIEEIIDKLVAIEEEVIQLYNIMYQAELIWYVTGKEGLREEFLEKANSLPTFRSFFDSISDLEQKKQALVTKAETLSRELDRETVTYRNWVCRSTSGGVSLQVNLEKLEALRPDLLEFQLDGKPLIKKTIDTSLLNSAIKAKKIEEEDLVEKGIITKTENTRRKYFKFKGEKDE